MSPQELAVIVDEYFDGLLYDGMPLFELQYVEEQRAEWHAKLTNETLAGAGNFRKL